MKQFYVALIMLGLTVLACGSPSESDVQTAIAETAMVVDVGEPEQVASLTPLSVPDPISSTPDPPSDTEVPSPATGDTPDGETASVVKVIDGDTIDVSINGQTYRVRYIGMNTPETNEPCGSEATDYNAGLVSGQTVTLVKDTSETDRYDRLLRYVYVGDTFVNATLVEDGYAEAAKYPPDDEYADFFDSLQDQAESANIGCWPTGVFSGAGDGSEAEEAEEPADGSAVATCPNVETCIKGNINSEGEKIYHLPDCPSYSRTQIDESKGERWFTTAVDAENAGWRIAGNC